MPAPAGGRPTKSLKQASHPNQAGCCRLHPLISYRGAWPAPTKSLPCGSWCPLWHLLLKKWLSCSGILRWATTGHLRLRCICAFPWIPSKKHSEWRNVSRSGGIEGRRHWTREGGCKPAPERAMHFILDAFSSTNKFKSKDLQDLTAGCVQCFLSPIE
jgi:hypothetical protein